MLVRPLPPSARLWVSTLARVALGAVMLAAGGLKIADSDAAIRAVQAYQLLPRGLDSVVGVGLPILEVALGVLLVLGVFTRVAAGVTGALMVLFIAGVSSAWARGLSIDCGCFGGGGTVAPDRTTYLAEILRDLLFLGLASWLVLFAASRLAVDRVHHDGPRGLDDDTLDAAPAALTDDLPTTTERT